MGPLLCEVFVIFYQKHEHLKQLFPERLKLLDQGNISLKFVWFSASLQDLCRHLIPDDAGLNRFYGVCLN